MFAQSFRYFRCYSIFCYKQNEISRLDLDLLDIFY